MLISDEENAKCPKRTITVVKLSTSVFYNVIIFNYWAKSA